MKSEFTIYSPLRDKIKLTTDDNSGWVKMQVNDNKEVEISFEDLHRVVDSINRFCTKR